MAKYLIILVFLISGCKGPHELSLDNEKPFTLIVRSIELGKSKKYVIAPDTKEYKALYSWLNENRKEWNKEPVKWLSPYELYGENYQLLFSKETAVIKIENNGKHTMWRKKIDQSLVNIFNEY